MSIHVVVMGVAGCGKSTVAEASMNDLDTRTRKATTSTHRRISTKCQPAFHSPMRTAGRG